MAVALVIVRPTFHDAISEKNPGDELGARICDVRVVDLWGFHD